MIPGSGRPPGEGTGYPLQYFGASLMAEMVKNLPVMRGTWVRSLGWEDFLEKEMTTYWEIPWTEEPGRLHTIYGVTRVRHDLATKSPPKKTCRKE